MTRSALRALLPKRSPQDHKGRHGHVLIVAGSRGMGGAAALAARAALRSGAGLVTLALPRGLQGPISASVPGAMTLGLREGLSGALAPAALSSLRKAHAAKDYTVLALGPGLSMDAGTGLLARDLLRGLSIPAVADADALNHLSKLGPSASARLMRGRAAPSIVTPHPGEMARCLAKSAEAVLGDRQGSALELSRRWKVACILKGHGSIVAQEGRFSVNETGGSGLAKGGSGDVLTGLVAGLWAQMIAQGSAADASAFRAALLGAHLHGAAGDLAQSELSPWAMTAQDVIDKLPRAFRALARA